MMWLMLLLLMFGAGHGKVDLYLGSEETMSLYGIKTDGLYYVRDGMVNKYAMTFQHQVIPAEIDHIDFSWRASPREAVTYKMTFIHTPGLAMDPPSVNVSMAGLVPTYTDKFRLTFPCTGKVDAEVDTLLQVSLDLGSREPEILNFKRRKICSAVSAVVTSPPPPAPASSVLLSSVSPSLFVALGAASASVLLLAVLVAAIYLRRIRKRGEQLSNEDSLRSSLHLHSDLEYKQHSELNFKHSDLEYSEKQPTLRAAESYATLASFTQVPLNRTEANTGGWARFTTPSEYSAPKSPLPLPHPSGLSSPHPSVRTPRSAHYASSLASLHSSLVYDANQAHVISHFTPNRTGGRTPGGGYSNCERPPRVQYPDYEYTTPGEAAHYNAKEGEASPYSVSSELYKHVMPQYFQFSRSTSRGSVLV